MNLRGIKEIDIARIQLYLVCGLAVPICAEHAIAQSYDWTTPISGSWHNNALWSPTGIPNAQTHNATLLAGGMPYTVTLSVGNVTVGNLSVVAPSAELELLRTLDVYGGLIVNDGLITVGDGVTGGAIRLRNLPAQSLTGTGTIILAATNPEASTATISRFSGANRLTIGAGQTITGHGWISTPITSAATITADASRIVLSPGFTEPDFSTGLIEATNGGVIQLRNVNVDMMGVGIVVGDGGNIHFEGSYRERLTNGTVTTTNGGLVRAINTAELEDMTLNGDMVADLRRTIRFYGSSFTNNGTVTVTADGVNGYSALEVYNSPYTFDGTGEMILNYPGALNPNSAATINDSVTGGGSVLTNGPSHTIRGKGRIAIDMVNQGTITADMADESFDLLPGKTLTNEATIRATNGGIFKVFGFFVQTGAGQVELDGGYFDIGAGSPAPTVTGGSINGVNGGKIVMVSGNCTMNSVTLNTDTDLFGQQITSSGSNVNNGTMVLQLDGGNYGILSFNAPQTWSGTGEIVLNADNENVLQYAQINRAGSGYEVTHGADHTIRGTGTIYAPFVNEGLITADVTDRTLLLQTDDKKNTGTIRADSGYLRIQSIDIDQTGGGLIEAVNNGEIRLGSATLINGEVDATGGLMLTSSGTNQINGITFAGQFDISATLNVYNTITNNGLWILKDTGATDNIVAVGPVTFDGSGILSMRGQIVSGSIIQQTSNGDITNGASHTIEGTGSFKGISILNHGALAPGQDTNPGSEIGEIRIDTGASIDCQSTSAVHLQLAGTNTGEFDRIFNGGGGPDTFHCDGTLNVSHINSFTGPSEPTTVDLITADAVTGTFSTVNLPAPAHGHYKIVYTATAVQLVLCYADCDASGSLNIFDYICFGNLYAAGDPYADCDGSGSLNVFDYICFGNEYAAGCP
ncbi:MAG: hypothetical protein H6815_00710 [Phycisphaeraceae bacterium]|nr:hypothetical protein [Phycisphaerales bacterium]MCB9858945.1 hypothetical protein [Phycisphaeraceae bacterium]